MTPTQATLLLTDVVDSTKLVETLGDARAARVWAAHDAVARDLLPAHGGREIDKTDGFLLLFDGPQEAVAYAVAYHQAIGRLDPPLQARAGLHLGEVVLRENPAEHVARGAKPLEVEGLAKPLAARVMSLAVGGQTLLTGPVRTALGEDAAVRSHGHYRMKGVAEPVELFELDTGAALTPPPDSAKVWRVVRQGDGWLAAEPPSHHLPAERDAFVGRDADLAALSRLVDGGARLVSVLGIGGTGKTRLVTRFAWTWLGQWSGGAWFADLSEARSVEGICHALARTLDVPLTQGEPVVQLGHALAGRGPCLVVLDNFEQVARHAEETLGRWLDRAPEVTFVATTREVLGLAGEQALALAPLQTPDAVRLFEERAAQAKAGFVVDAGQRQAVHELVRLLDHLPLAIELAAARVRVMPPDKLLARMDQRFKLLASTGGRRDRQATLRAAIDWSWDLLSPDERAALAQLSVFEGGLTLEAAEAVLELDALWGIDAVQSLVDKSLVRQVSDDRFDLLVSVQAYAAEKLDQAGLRAGAEARHGAFFAQQGGSEGLAALRGPDSVARFRALRADLDNLVAACRRAIARGEARVAVDSAVVCALLLEHVGPADAAVRLLDGVLGMAELDLGSRAGAECALGRLRRILGQLGAAREHLERAVDLARQGGDRQTEVLALYERGSTETGLGRAAEGLPWLEQALAVGGGDALAPWLRARVLCSLSEASGAQGALDQAVSLAREALDTARVCGDPFAVISIMSDLAIHLQGQGQVHEAHALLVEALSLARAAGSRLFEGVILVNLGAAAFLSGHPELAQPCFRDCVRVSREVGFRKSELIALGNLAYLALLDGRLDEAVTEFQACVLLARELGVESSETNALSNLAIALADQGRWAEARARFDEARARYAGAGERLGLAQLLAEWAPREARVDPAAAAAVLAEAEALADALGVTAESELSRTVAQARAALA